MLVGTTYNLPSFLQPQGRNQTLRTEHPRILARTNDHPLIRVPGTPRTRVATNARPDNFAPYESLEFPRIAI